VLSYMSPERAKDLTVQLAEQRKLQKPSGGNSTTPAAKAPTNQGR